jgi:NADH-quinone oxidoreductase subunit M
LLGNIIYVGFVTLAQKRLDWMLGYSSVMHMGYIFLGIASANIIGLNGAALLMFAHGISIALLFALAGEIRRRTGTLVFSDLGGLGKAMPFAGLAFGLATFAAIGLPGFANFAADVMVFFGAFRAGRNWNGLALSEFAAVLALWGVVISAVYMLRAYRAIFMGEMSPESLRGQNPLSDLSGALRIPIILLVAVTLIVGCYPNSILRVLRPTFAAPVVSTTNP